MHWLEKARIKRARIKNARASRWLGRRGEKLARKRLESYGLRFVDRNVRVGRGEIDLVMLDEQTLVFVEVKTRSASTWSDGFDKIDSKKRRVFRAASSAYVRRVRHEGDWRIDVVLIELAAGWLGRIRECTWIPHAF